MEENPKERELMRFLQAEAARLHMNVPSPSAISETIQFLSETNPRWENQISPDEFARLMKSRYPELRFEWSEEEAGAASEDEPATEKQIAYLRVLEVPIPEYLGIREASDLIEKYKNRISEGQKRRLEFYKISYDPQITREQANELIDSYKAQHPESEAAYQEWKKKSGKTSNIEH